MNARGDELAANLAAVRARIDAACAAAGRPPDDVALIAVTKTFPASDVALLAELGVREIGENRDAEAAPKAAELAAAGVDVHWHFIGQLQRNKARSVVQYADLVHSVDRVPLVRALAEAAHRYRRRPLDVLIQVGLSAEPGRGGVAPAELPELVDAVLGADALRLRGLMAVAPLGADPDPAFAALAEHAARLRDRVPEATIISAGMTGDLEQAIHHGATHVRVGSGLLGRRARVG